jgi:hypothetical protein
MNQFQKPPHPMRLSEAQGDSTMSDQQTTSNYREVSQSQEPPPSGWATGFIMFAGVMWTSPSSGL